MGFRPVVLESDLEVQVNRPPPVVGCLVEPLMLSASARGARPFFTTAAVLSLSTFARAPLFHSRPALPHATFR